MAEYRVVFKGKNSRQAMFLQAKNEEEARKLAEETQTRRAARFPLTFARLEQAKDSGEMGLLAASGAPVGSPAVDMKKWVDAQIEMRKRDQARYEADELKIESVEKM